MKLKLTIAGKQHELTVEEAKALHAELAKVFGGAPIIIERSHPLPMPYPVPAQPWQWDPDPIYPMYQPTITCGDPRHNQFTS